MASLSRGCCRPSPAPSVLLYCHFINPKPFRLPLRTYATRQAKPLKYKPSAPKPQIQRSPKSTPATTSKPPVPLQPNFRQVFYSEALNPPSTTLPPPLDLPTRDPETPNYKYYYRLGKAYATFYKNGLKAIWTNYKAVRALNPPSDLYTAVITDKITRANFQLICRSRADTRKLPPFILLWLVCGEFTPLVVLYVGAIIPKTIWIPKQFEAARKKAEARRTRFGPRSVTDDIGPLSSQLLDRTKEPIPPRTQRAIFSDAARCYGLYPVWWDQVFGERNPQWEIRRRLRKYVRYIETDDYAIEKDGGIGGLDEREVVRACEERAIDVLGKGDKELRSELNKYFQKWKQRQPVYERWQRDGTGP